MLTLSDVRDSRYLLYRALAELFPADRAALAVDVLLGPERDEPPAEEWQPDRADEFIPSPEDEDWLARLDIEEAARYAAWVELRRADRDCSDADLRSAGLAVG